MINIANKARAYSEVYSFVNAFGDELKNKIPTKLYNKIEFNRAKEYNPVYNVDEDIDELDISKEALSLIAALYLQYICEDENEKNKLKSQIKKNGEIEQNRLLNLYDNTLYAKKEKEEEQQQSSSNIIKYEKQNIFQKIRTWFKNLFTGKKE